MPNTKDIVVKCEKCNNNQKYTYPKVVHISLEKDLKYEYINKIFADFVCEKCGLTKFVKRDFLYEDTKNHLMFWLKYPAEDGGIYLPQESEQLISISEKDYVFRVIPTYEDFLEKIRIYDDGFDDLSIEILKVFISIKGKIKLSEPFYYIGINKTNPLEKTMLFVLPQNEFHNEIEYPLEDNMCKITKLCNEYPQLKQTVHGKFSYLQRGFVLDLMQEIGIVNK